MLDKSNSFSAGEQDKQIISADRLKPLYMKRDKISQAINTIRRTEVDLENHGIFVNEFNSVIRELREKESIVSKTITELNFKRTGLPRNPTQEEEDRLLNERLSFLTSTSVTSLSEKSTSNFVFEFLDMFSNRSSSSNDVVKDILVHAKKEVTSGLTPKDIIDYYIDWSSTVTVFFEDTYNDYQHSLRRASEITSVKYNFEKNIPVLG